ncbi:MAG: flagellar hook capping FlgD N-terminal domain-containing protein [Methylocystaceae bacterium]
MTTNVTPGSFNTATSQTTTTTKSASTSLGKDDFLKLLITELQYQNPLEPLEDKDFIGQMANFSSLEQMQNLNKSFESLASSNQDQTNSLSLILTQLISGNQLQQAAALIGKEVEYSVTDDAGGVTKATGNVESVTRENNTVYLNVDGKKVTLNQISVIK